MRPDSVSSRGAFMSDNRRLVTEGPTRYHALPSPPTVSCMPRCLLLLVLFLLSLSGCSKSPSGDIVTLRFWHSFVASTRPALASLIERFEAEHPHIRISEQYVPTGDALVQKLVASHESGTAPDISWVHADFLGKLAAAGAVHPMHRFIDGSNGLSEADLADFLPGLLEASSWHDTLYAMPMEATLLALVYNKEQFREVGLNPDDPPADWDELAEYVRKLTRDRDGDGRLDRFGFYLPVFTASGPLNIWMVLQWSTFLWQAGGDLIDLDQSRVLYAEPPGVEALSYWSSLYEAMQRPAFSMPHDATFVSGQTAMIMDGPWDLPRLHEAAHFEWGIAPLPGGPAGQVTYLAGEQLAIFRQSPHPDEAWAFIKWILQPEIQAFFSAESGYLPVRQSALDLPEYRDHLEEDWALRAFVEQIPLARVRRSIDDHHVEINRHVAEAIERTLVGREDPAAALRAAAARSDALLEKE